MNGARIMLAPDSFKGTMSAATVAEALADGVIAAGGAVDSCPVADGGEGTLEALRSSVPGTLRHVDATAPDGAPVRASYLLGADGVTAVIETASASGLHLIDVDRVDAFAATSRGTGEVISAAVAAGATDILLGVGGSGCTDGGLGAVAAIAEAGGLGQARLTVLCDVVTPYEEAARVFAPQKGADPETVERLTSRLHTTAAGLPRDPRAVARTGAAGGLAGGLWASFDAALVSGIDVVLERSMASLRLAQADAVITGEGCLDAQTAQGKVVEGVSRWARHAGVPAYAVVGRNAAAPSTQASLGLVAVLEAGTPALLRHAATVITEQVTQARPSRPPARTDPVQRSRRPEQSSARPLTTPEG
jgi:glycerate kinase